MFLIACYFNSLIQSYYYIPQFSRRILESASIELHDQWSIKASNVGR